MAVTPHAIKDFADNPLYDRNFFREIFSFCSIEESRNLCKATLGFPREEPYQKIREDAISGYRSQIEKKELEPIFASKKATQLMTMDALVRSANEKTIRMIDKHIANLLHCFKKEVPDEQIYTLLELAYPIRRPESSWS